MSEQRLIDADVLKDILMQYFDINNDTYYYNLTRVKSAFDVGTMTLEDFEEFTEETVDDLVAYIIRQAPIVEDVMQVVRCKNCEQWSRNIGIVDSSNGHCFYHDIEMNGCDFCSYGERRGEGE